VTEPAATFADAIRAAGFEPPATIEPGRLVRFAAPGKGRSNVAGWALLFQDGTGGVFGDWITSARHTWQASRPANDAELKRWREQIARAQRKAERERQREAEAAAERAAAAWAAAGPADPDHPYLQAKGIGPNGARQDGARLVIPVRNAAGAIRSMQRIGPEGRKRFEAGGTIAGHYFSIGKPAGTVIVAEGFATGATIHEATGHAVAVAFNAGNLEPVARAIRSKLPAAVIVIAADDDADTEGNPGITKASAAAKACAGILATPARPGDFNDLAAAEGPDAVRGRIDQALASRLPAMTRPLVEIEPEPIRWLWPNRIARGKLTVIAGDPKVGKSLITADLTARISAGLEWPDRCGPAPRGAVIFASAEDDPADTIRPRIEAAGGDVARVFIVGPITDLDKDGAPFERGFNLKKDVHRLALEIERIGNVAAVIVDPVSAYLGGADSHNNAEVRELLAPLARLASDHRVAVIAVSHLNKGAGSNALYRVSGSLAFTAAARAVLLVAKDADNEHRRLMIPAGSNIAPDIGGLAYSIRPVETDLGPVPVLDWEPDAIEIDSTAALETDSDERAERTEAAEWLEHALKDGPLKAAEIRKRANAEGLAWRTVQRARRAAGVVSIRDGFGSGSRWILKDHNTGGNEHDGSTVGE